MPNPASQDWVNEQIAIGNMSGGGGTPLTSAAIAFVENPGTSLNGVQC